MPRVRRGFGGKLLSCRISRGCPGGGWRRGSSFDQLRMNDYGRMNDDVAGGRMAALPGGRGGGVGKISQVIERLENEYGNAIARSRG